MATKQLTLPGQVVKKHNTLVRSKITLDSAQGSKILASLIACIQPDDETFKEAYRISVKDFLPDTGGGNYRQDWHKIGNIRRVNFYSAQFVSESP